MLPIKLLKLELYRRGIVKYWYSYIKIKSKLLKIITRIEFLKMCCESKVIPSFLKFRVPNIGCFNKTAVEKFQSHLLRTELRKARVLLDKIKEDTMNCLIQLRNTTPTKLIPTLLWHARRIWFTEKESIHKRHEQKLLNLAIAQDRPIARRNMKALYMLDTNENLPEYVRATLSKGPNHPILDTFDEKYIAAEMNSLIEHHEKLGMSQDTINDINVASYKYIKDVRKQKTNRASVYTSKYLKTKQLLAVPYDKGKGFCLMKEDTYRTKLEDITNGAQFEKITNTRKNARHIIIKEEERINDVIETLKNEGKINTTLASLLTSRGGQPPRLYGLAKIHKDDIPLRPVVSMPGSPYYNIGKKVAEWLERIEESNINCNTPKLMKLLKSTQLRPNRELVSFDVKSLYTNVPVNEAIEMAATKLFDKENYDNDEMEIDRETFITLAKLSCTDVIFSSPSGYFKQRDGLAMGIQPAGQLANIWLSSFEETIKDDATIFERYMDDILLDVEESKINNRLTSINELHEKLQFTLERPIDHTIPFLDMKITKLEDGKLETMWYRKPTDTGLTLNYHANAPTKYKRNVIQGLTHRIYNSCSTWSSFHKGLEEGIKILKENQYPEELSRSIIKVTLDKLYKGDKKEKVVKNDTEERIKKWMFLPYRGHMTDTYIKNLTKMGALIKPIITTKKTKDALPTLKPRIPNELKSKVVYQFTCCRCNSTYVGKTKRHLKTRV